MPALFRCLTYFLYTKVQGHIKNLIEENFRDELEQAMRDPILFGDFRMALNEGEPRIYEDIQAYDVAKNLFQVVCFSLELCVIFVSLHEQWAGNCTKQGEISLYVHTYNSVHRRLSFGIWNYENRGSAMAVLSNYLFSLMIFTSNNVAKWVVILLMLLFSWSPSNVLTTFLCRRFWRNIMRLMLK